MPLTSESSMLATGITPGWRMRRFAVLLAETPWLFLFVGCSRGCK